MRKVFSIAAVMFGALGGLAGLAISLQNFLVDLVAMLGGDATSGAARPEINVPLMALYSS